MMSVLFSAFLLHQIENYRLEKLFYHESDQQLELEVMMKYTWDTIHEELKEEKHVLTADIVFPTGNALVTTRDLGPEVEIIIVCSTQKGREYKATILYDKENYKVRAWYETI
ncbi:hypothetical protein AB685_04360 [Bacillus sp. LL01]|uniref:competence type IV pilus minor pilin ComGG n=1 Tax=Bacillus sp. LL01 TaxID=1665556 RepID=UPI00064CEE90|nr:competence type IV pilus minor pilin ComGG [Bacillus sp. LL01]KMJ60078.1 hypothetical protein AB685_04360 [Bacillus sp. LL01]